MGMFPLGIGAELFLNRTWTDISQYLYQRDGVHITGGAQNWGEHPQPAQCTFTVNNRDGRFSPNYAGGAWYPYLVRNTPVRVQVVASSSSGNFYSGFRFAGEVAEWPPLSDISGRDVYVQVVANGPLRRVNTAGGQGSALTRYYGSLPGGYAPVAYWPMEEDQEFSDPAGDLVGTGVQGGTPMTIVSGTPTFKAITRFNGSAPFLVVNNSFLDGLTGSFGTSGDDIFLTPGTYKWVSGVSSVNCKVWGAGGGGANGSSGNAGGGGAFAQEATLAVTPGTAYTLIVGAGGRGGVQQATGANRDGAPGGFSSFQGDAVLVKALGGGAGTSAGPGAGGVIGSNTVKFAGGAAGAGASPGGGGGGGSSAGTAASGNAGSAGAGNTGGAGGAAPAGGGAGGRGGDTPDDVNGRAGASPGGGGGGGAAGLFVLRAGFNGGGGKVELVYTPASAPSANVTRFIMFVPKHGGNSNRVLVRTLTGGTIARLDVLYQAGGKILLKGYNNALTLLFTSGTVTVGDGQPVLVSAELTTSGANVAWKLTAIIPGAAAVIGTVTGTQATATVGNVSEVLVGPNADITKTGIGHLSVQYAVLDIRQVSNAINGHHTELTADRLIRIANEQALDQEPRFAEAADHWGFEPGIQSWTGTNATVTQSSVHLSGLVPWSFAANGTPLNNSYFIATTGQAASLAIGHQHVSAKNPGTIFTISYIGAPAFGFQNINMLPMSPVLMDSTDTVTQYLNYQNPGILPAISPVWPTEGSHSLLITAAGGAGQWLGQSPGGLSGQPVQAGDTLSVAADVYAPAQLNAVGLAVDWFNAAGTYLSTTSGSTIVVEAGSVKTVHIVNATAPALTAFFRVTVLDNETVAANTLLYVDHVRVGPRMGPQARRELAAYLKEIRALDQGILRESRILNALGFRTRFSIINQPAAVTLDYAAGMLSPPLAPVVDTQRTFNVITVKRVRGGRVTAYPPPSGPPAGFPSPAYKKIDAYVASADAQLAALAQHLLNLGTAPDERYPTITVTLDRASLPGNALAPLMSAVAQVEIGDRVALVNLPFWFPATTASQLVIGYDEHINATPQQGQPGWVITWNCVPESPWEITATSLRRW